MGKRTGSSRRFAAVWIAIGLLCMANTTSGQIESLDSGAEETEAAIAQSETALATWLDGVATVLMREHDLPGLTLSIVREGQPIVLRGYGAADAPAQRPVDAERTLFRIGSISKTFTWTAAMMMVDRGRLDLDRDVNEYLESVEVRPAFGQPVTMNHLMAHRAGFEDTLGVFTVSNEDNHSLSQLLEIHQPERVYPPGERTSYSNWGAALAAQVVAYVAGVPYSDFLRDEILDPLGMTNTTLTAPGAMPEALSERLARPHDKRGDLHEPMEYLQLGAFAPAGGMSSTAADMARWMRFHLGAGELDGVRLMSRETHSLMLSRAYPDRAAADDLAHGFQSSSHRGVAVFGHSGSTGGFHSRMVVAPELGMGVFASQNSGSGGYASVSALTDLALDHALDATRRPLGRPESTSEAGPGSLAEYAGDYVNNRRTFTTMPTILGAQVDLQVADDGTSLLVTRAGDIERFWPVTGNQDIFENREGDRLAFQRDAADEIVAANDSSGVHSFERQSLQTSPRTLHYAVAATGLLAITSLLGFWRRWRLMPESTAFGRWCAAIHFLGALTVAGYLVVAWLLIVSASSIQATDLLDYPWPLVRAMHWAGWILLGAAVLNGINLLPAWIASNWTTWRRCHFTAFALALGSAAYLLWQWRAIGAPYL